MIEKGRHLKPKLERSARKCYVCKDEIEDEEHFLITCPLLSITYVKKPVKDIRV